MRYCRIVFVLLLALALWGCGGSTAPTAAPVDPLDESAHIRLNARPIPGYAVPALELQAWTFAGGRYSFRIYALAPHPALVGLGERNPYWEVGTYRLVSGHAGEELLRLEREHSESWRPSARDYEVNPYHIYDLVYRAGIQGARIGNDTFRRIALADLPAVLEAAYAGTLEL